MKVLSTAMMTMYLMSAPALLRADADVSVDDCVALAPANEQFQITVDMSVDTDPQPAARSGRLGVSNDSGPELAEEEQQKFQPMVQCLAELLK